VVVLIALLIAMSSRYVYIPSPQKPCPLPNQHCSLQFYPVDNVTSNFASPLLYFKFFVLGGVSMFGWITTVAPTIISIEMSLGLEGEVGACARKDEVDFQWC
jgi:hypothetical protein